MSRDKNNGLVGLALFGAVMFGIGRCSVSTPMPPSQPAALFDATAGNAADNAVAAADAAMNAASANMDAASAPAAEAIAPPAQAMTPAPALAPAPSGNSCGSKHLCRQMDSCDEAYHYLNDCGVGRLDGDGDGVPCESICG